MREHHTIFHIIVMSRQDTITTYNYKYRISFPFHAVSCMILYPLSKVWMSPECAASSLYSWEQVLSSSSPRHWQRTSESHLNVLAQVTVSSCAAESENMLWSNHRPPFLPYPPAFVFVLLNYSNSIVGRSSGGAQRGITWTKDMRAAAFADLVCVTKMV